MDIRETEAADLPAVLDVVGRAFGDGREAELVRNLLADPSAAPTLSLLALEDGQPVGHILFSRALLLGADGAPLDIPIALLAPLAVVPEAQNRGIGGDLVFAGLKRLRDDGFALVTVLGHPDYYPRFGFRPASPLGLEAPYPLPEGHEGAWMAASLSDAAPEGFTGQVQIADCLDKPEYWAPPDTAK